MSHQCTNFHAPRARYRLHLHALHLQMGCAFLCQAATSSACPIPRSRVASVYTQSHFATRRVPKQTRRALPPRPSPTAWPPLTRSPAAAPQQVADLEAEFTLRQQRAAARLAAADKTTRWRILTASPHRFLTPALCPCSRPCKTLLPPPVDRYDCMETGMQVRLHTVPGAQACSLVFSR